MHRLGLLPIAAALALAIGPPQQPESSLGRYPVPDVVPMTGRLLRAPAHCIRSLELRPVVMLRGRRYDVEARIRIEAHLDHRAFALAYASDVGAAGESIRELNNLRRCPDERTTCRPDETVTDRSPVTQEPIRIPRTPGGHYFVSLAVYGADGRVLERRAAEIRAAEDDQ